MDITHEITIISQVTDTTTNMATTTNTVITTTTSMIITDTKLTKCHHMERHTNPDSRIKNKIIRHLSCS